MPLLSSFRDRLISNALVAVTLHPRSDNRTEPMLLRIAYTTRAELFTTRPNGEGMDIYDLRGCRVVQSKTDRIIVADKNGVETEFDFCPPARKQLQLPTVTVTRKVSSVVGEIILMTLMAGQRKTVQAIQSSVRIRADFQIKVPRVVSYLTALMDYGLVSRMDFIGNDPCYELTARGRCAARYARLATLAEVTDRERDKFYTDLCMPHVCP